MQTELTQSKFKNKFTEIAENLTIQEGRKKYIADNKLRGHDKRKLQLLKLINRVYTYLSTPLMSVYSDTLKVYTKNENPYITFMDVYGKDIQLTGINDVDFYRQFETYVFRPSDYNFAYDLSGVYVYNKDYRFHIFKEGDSWIFTFEGDRVGIINPRDHREAVEALSKLFKCFT